MFQLLNLAGAFVILAPFLVSLRNIYEKSAMAREIWPVMSPEIIIDLMVNHPQTVATAMLGAIAIFAVYALLRAFFSAGIYRVVLEMDAAGERSLRTFLVGAARIWTGFIKVAVFGIIVYTIAAFLGATLARLLSGLGDFWMVVFFTLPLYIGSIYLQVLRIRIATENDNSLRGAAGGTRRILAASVPRIILGNISVGLAGIAVTFILWVVIRWLRGGEWSSWAAVVTIILEQAIIFVLCLMQAIRINFNHSILKKGAYDALGGTELGPVREDSPQTA